MSKVRTAAGGGRVVEVAPERLAGWFDRFAARNDGIRETAATEDEVVVTAGNGTTATVAVPFPPLPGGGPPTVRLVLHAKRPRRVGLLLVRLGAHSVGVAEGGEVTVSRTDRHHVHGRSAAGGWSQQRFARRREGQARQALREAADDALEVLGPRLSELDAVVLGGDRRALDELRADRRLEPVFSLALPRILDISEPRRAVLDEAAERARAVEIVVRQG
ncbi:acVLRF1 family peptidyl-tRNA hydrolase [Amycolatopsis cynarae]|uniref:AcVLRF1 family peptidyl-tRNA hydrolase n=1 Tax=Amycolatopsis cynarae TaxID=2995223 RepID=A0ABY7ASU9_9PSEU|nr:acVLRF1 family peptidyl-tRNA hydrolase [Amycolatopsis sp. HUAS 11-8]WAL63019.1 acVLRF1 family peptidyl-tRNA hydrolase [Amycolatopsis sp. HUAS 11-8]